MSDLEDELSRRARRLLAAYGKPSEYANSPAYRYLSVGCSRGHADQF